jgi:hypothetical protein
VGATPIFSGTGSPHIALWGILVIWRRFSVKVFYLVRIYEPKKG